MSGTDTRGSAELPSSTAPFGRTECPTVQLNIVTGLPEIGNFSVSSHSHVLLQPPSGMPTLRPSSLSMNIAAN